MQCRVQSVSPRCRVKYVGALRTRMREDHTHMIIAIHESFLREILVLYRNAKVFSLESFPLNGSRNWNCHDSKKNVIGNE